MLLSQGLSFQNALVEFVFGVSQVVLEPFELVGEFLVLGNRVVEVVAHVLVLVLALLALLLQLVSLVLELLMLVVQLVQLSVGRSDHRLSVLHLLYQLKIC